MGRSRNSDARGGSFPEAVVAAVWEKGTAVAGNDPAVFRQDQCKAWMKRTDYGDVNSKYGWEIDHIKPVAAGGGDGIANLQPLQWQNNRGKGDSYPNWTCTV